MNQQVSGTSQQTLPPQELILRLRQRIEAGEKLTRDEVRQGLDALRRDRQAAVAGTRKKSTPAGPTRSAEELMALLNKPVETK